MAIPLVVIVGADKGGVGKTTTSRALMDYYKSQGVDVRAFDTESPLGVLKRFFPLNTEIVDLEKSSELSKVFDELSDEAVTLIDVRAGLLSKSLKTLANLGLFDLVKDNKVRVVVLHVIGSSVASFNEIKTTQAALPGCKHYLVVNHMNGAPFFEWNGDATKLALSVGDGVLDIPLLDETSIEYVETAGIPFFEFIATSRSFVYKGFVRHWLAAVFEQFNKAKELLGK